MHLIRYTIQKYNLLCGRPSACPITIISMSQLLRSGGLESFGPAEGRRGARLSVGGGSPVALVGFTSQNTEINFHTF